MPEPTLIPPTDQTQTPTLLNNSAPTEFVPDTTKTAEENAAAKTAFDAAAVTAKKDADDKAAKEADDKRTQDEKDAAAKANDTKANPFKPEELKVPEGMQIDETTSKGFIEIVNKFGIGRDAIAELTTLQANAMKAVSEGNTQAWTKMQDDWRKEVESDSDIGGEKLQPALGGISKLIDKYGSPELRLAFDFTGAGNNPHVIKFLSKLSKDFGERGFVPPGSPPSGPKTQAEILYPNQGL